MQETDLIALLLTVIAAIVALYIFRRVLIFVVVLILVGVIGYFALQDKDMPSAPSKPQTTFSFDKFRSNQKSKKGVSYLDSFKSEFCGVIFDKEDSLKCYIIAEPIVEQLTRDYTTEELSSMNKTQFIQAVLKAAAKQKQTIMQRLGENKANYLWEDFIEETKQLQF